MNQEEIVKINTVLGKGEEPVESAKILGPTQLADLLKFSAFV